MITVMDDAGCAAVAQVLNGRRCPPLEPISMHKEDTHAAAPIRALVRSGRTVRAHGEREARGWVRRMQRPLHPRCQWMRGRQAHSQQIRDWGSSHGDGGEEGRGK